MGPIFEKSYDEFMVIINYQCKKNQFETVYNSDTVRNKNGPRVGQ